MRIVFRMTVLSLGISLSLLCPVIAVGQCPPIPEGTLPQSGKLALNALKTKTSNKLPTDILAQVHTPAPQNLVARYGLDKAIPAADARPEMERRPSKNGRAIDLLDEFKGPLLIHVPGAGLVSSIIEQDGKFLLVGGSDPYTGEVVQQGVFLARFEANGKLDPTFGQGGSTRITLFEENNMVNGSSVAVALSPSGKIVIARTINDFFPVKQPGFLVSVARFESDGALDQSFGNGGIIYTTIDNYFEVFDVAVQRDERIVVAGRSGHTGSCLDQACMQIATLMRYQPNGQPDPSFGNAGLVKTQLLTGGTPPLLAMQSVYTSLRVQENGLIVAAGTVHTAASPLELDSKMLIAEYLPTGELNPVFGNDGAVTLSFDGPYQKFTAYSVAIQENGKIVAGGTATLYSVNLQGGTTDKVVVDEAFIVARLTAGGELDSTFGNSGKLVVDVNPRLTGTPPRPLDSLSKVLIDSSGMIYAVGMARGPIGSSEKAINLVAIKSDGSLNQGFGTGGIYSFGTYAPWGMALAQDALLTGDGRLLVSGVRWPDQFDPHAFVLWAYSLASKPTGTTCP